MFYTGVGSRSTPNNVLNDMKDIASLLERLGFILRSGAAEGADSMFESGLTKPKQSSDIFLPWKGFNNRFRNLDENVFDEPLTQAFDIASKYHPNFNNLSDTNKKFHARNVHQVLGYYLDEPSQFLICWTPDGCENHATRTKQTGGTGQAISIADDYNVPVFNLSNNNSYDRLRKKIRSFYG